MRFASMCAVDAYHAVQRESKAKSKKDGKQYDTDAKHCKSPIILYPREHDQVYAPDCHELYDVIAPSWPRVHLISFDEEWAHG
mmetsp:Transcript_127948/g.239342  ORF Transcript_127948/g.239342 Transcript_127948/m.239342 type:complete len:83 (+) Transcript_127948:617-865(+)